MIVVDKTLCGGCGVCVDACPTEAITLINDLTLVDADRLQYFLHRRDGFLVTSL